MDPHINQLLGLSDELAGEHRHRGRSVADLAVLHPGHLHKHLKVGFLEKSTAKAEL